MELNPDGPLAIPLWVNGHALLTMTDEFIEVPDALDGRSPRKVPVCGAGEAAEVAAASAAAQPGWAAMPLPARMTLLSALADALEGYASHFAKLLRQDSGWDEGRAGAEVAAAVAALSDTALGNSGVVAVASDATQPLAGLLRLAAPALASGATVVLKPSPRAPAAAYALCELATRAGWPAGVLNLLHGDEAALEGLCGAETVSELAFAGAPELVAKVAAIAERQGKPFRSLAA